MDRTIERLAATGSSIPQDLQRDDTGPVADPGARGWARVSQLRGGPVRPQPEPRDPGAHKGRIPVNHALRQFLETGSSAPPSMRGTGRTAALDRPEGPAPQGDYGPWAQRSQEPPAGYETAMGDEA
jgi:hypothetical protein